MTLTDSTIARNTGTYSGGIANGGTLTAVNCTVAYNGALSGYSSDAGGIVDGYSYGGVTTTLDNTIVAHNSNEEEADDVSGGPLASTSDNAFFTSTDSSAFAVLPNFEYAHDETGSPAVFSRSVDGIVVATVPEASTLAMGVIGVLALLGYVKTTCRPHSLPRP